MRMPDIFAWGIAYFRRRLGSSVALAVLVGILWAGPPLAFGQGGGLRLAPTTPQFTHQWLGKRLKINTHGQQLPPALVHYLNQEGELLLLKHRALGIHTPKDFYYQIDFLPSYEAFEKYSKSKGVTTSRGMLGYTELMVSQTPDGNLRQKPQFPVSIVCFWNQDEPFETFPTLIHEMAHAVHAADYGALPLWLQEGMADWYAGRKHLLAAGKKRDNMIAYQRYMDLVQDMDETKFRLFIEATKYEEWDILFGSRGKGYFLAETLVDFFIGNPVFQTFFRSALKNAKDTSDWQFSRSLACAQDIKNNWPGGTAMLLKGWKNWYKAQSLPKDTRALDPYLDANRQHFHALESAMRRRATVSDRDRHQFVSAWLAYKRLEADDLNAKLRESFNASENLRFRTQLAHVQNFAMRDHLARSGFTNTRRSELAKAQPNSEDPFYRRTLPYQPLMYYLNLDITQQPHPRPAYTASTGLPENQFQWTGLDPWQANMVFTNLFRLHLGKPPEWPAPKFDQDAKGVLTEALKKYPKDPARAVRAIGGKIERNEKTGEISLLDLSGTSIDNRDLEHLPLLFDPLELDLSGTDISPRSARFLEGWTRLRRVKLRGTRISQSLAISIATYNPGIVVE